MPTNECLKNYEKQKTRLLVSYAHKLDECNNLSSVSFMLNFVQFHQIHVRMYTAQKLKGKKHKKMP